MEVNFPLRSPTNSGLHLGVTLFERGTEQTASCAGQRVAHGFLPAARVEIASRHICLAKASDRREGRRRRRESQKQNGHIATVALRQPVFLQDIWERKLNRVLVDDKSERRARAIFSTRGFHSGLSHLIAFPYRERRTIFMQLRYILTRAELSTK